MHPCSSVPNPSPERQQQRLQPARSDWQALQSFLPPRHTPLQKGHGVGLGGDFARGWPMPVSLLYLRSSQAFSFLWAFLVLLGFLGFLGFLGKLSRLHPESAKHHDEKTPNSAIRKTLRYQSRSVRFNRQSKMPASQVPEQQAPMEAIGANAIVEQQPVRAYPARLTASQIPPSQLPSASKPLPNG